MADQEYANALQAANIAFGEAWRKKNDWKAECEKALGGNSDFIALAEAAEAAIAAAEAAGSTFALAQTIRTIPLEEAQNDAARTAEHNKGVKGLYHCIEASMIIFAYLIFGTRYCFKHSREYQNMDAGNRLLNASYFVVVTALTIGYGDIYPLTSRTKMDTVFLVLAGILISILGSTLIYEIKWWMNKTYFRNVKGLKKDCLLFGLSLVGVIVSIGIGMLGIFLLEHRESDHYKMTVKDSFYLSVLTLATVGYGDSYFQMKGGRAFAIPWIMVCYPIFHESSRFIMRSIMHLWRSIATVCWKKIALWLKTFFQQIVVPKWNQLKEYVKDVVWPKLQDLFIVCQNGTS